MYVIQNSFIKNKRHGKSLSTSVYSFPLFIFGPGQELKEIQEEAHLEGKLLAEAFQGSSSEERLQRLVEGREVLQEEETGGRWEEKEEVH